MPLLGAHMPTKGNLASALDAGRAIGCEVVQLFIKNPMQWKALPLSDAVVSAFHEAQKRTGIRLLAAHAAYLINLASPNSDVLAQSRRALLDELQRCQALGIPLLVVHAGAHLGSGERKGIQRLRDSLNWLLDRTGWTSVGRAWKPYPTFSVTLLVENTAGQGSCLGYTLEQLAATIDGLPHERVSICLDTCHLFAAGYDFRTNSGVQKLGQLIDETIGWRQVKLLHANDAQRPLGSRVDRHWHIGDGHIGKEGFRRLLTHPRFAQIPVVIETPDAERMHAENLQRLRQLIAG